MTIDEYHGVSEGREAVLWLEQQVAAARASSDGIHNIVAELTPHVAEALLGHNEDNRKISKVTVERFARDMIYDRWQMNGEPIIISTSGKLNDGQHRCAAVVAAQKSVKCLFVFGVARSTRTTVDQGKVRAVGDYLAMDGYEDSGVLGTAAGYLCQYQVIGRLSHEPRLRPTKSEVQDLVSVTPKLAEWVKWVPVRKNVLRSRALAAFCLYALAERVGDQAAAEFGEHLLQGIGLEPDSPVLYLRNRLMSTNTRLKPGEKAELVFRAWNAHRRRLTGRYLAILGGALPKLAV